MDANYKFIYLDVGASGRAGDAGLFNDSLLRNALTENALNIPPPINIEGISGGKINYHIVGDDAFSMTKTMMKPYPHRHLDKTKRIFNYRLSRARRVVENAFGILAHRFRVFLTTIKLSPERVTYSILASCCLHNYMVEKNKQTYTSVCDDENADYTLSDGAWRDDPPLTDLHLNQHRNPTRSAKEQRELLTKYFSDTGSVPWQEYMIQ